MKKILVPLQSMAALFLCAGMAWMVLLVAGTDPTPPSALDLQARSTKDLSFASMNSTAIALAGQMAGAWLPSPPATFSLPVTGANTATVVPVVTLKVWSTLPAVPTTRLSGLPSPTTAGGKSDRPPTLALSLFTPTAASTLRPTSIPSSTPTWVPTPTLPAATPSAISTPRPTNLPSSTPTRLPTLTQIPTGIPSSTSVPPTAGPTSTTVVLSTPMPLPTSTPKPEATATPAAPNTQNPTDTPKPANTPKPENTHKPRPSDTPEPPATEPPTP